MTQNSHEEVIRRLAWETRLELEDYWGWTGDPQTMVGTCRDASHDLARRLQAAGVPAEPWWCTYLDADAGYSEAVRLSGMDDDDYIESDGTWSHWVVICETVLVDITQDQFYPARRDHERVVITDVWNRDYRLGDVVESLQPGQHHTPKP